MSKKKLQVEGIINELEGASLYFSKPATPPLTPITSQAEPNVRVSQPEIQIPVAVNEKAVQPSKPTKSKKLLIEKKHAIVHASTHASMLAHNQDDLIETIRKTVKQVGKDTVFIRLTPEEKSQLASAVFTFNELYRGNNQKIPENLVGRIALNWLLNDYRENGELSILAKVLTSLNA